MNIRSLYPRFTRYNMAADTPSPDYQHESQRGEEDVRDEIDQAHADNGTIPEPINRVRGGQSWNHTIVPARHPEGRMKNRAMDIMGPHPFVAPVANEESKPQ